MSFSVLCIHEGHVYYRHTIKRTQKWKIKKKEEEKKQKQKQQMVEGENITKRIGGNWAKSSRTEGLKTAPWTFSLRSSWMLSYKFCATSNFNEHQKGSWDRTDKIIIDIIIACQLLFIFYFVNYPLKRERLKKKNTLQKMAKN